MAQRQATKPKHWLDFKAIKEAARFEPILSRYGLELTRQGSELVGRCPFHEDKKPSFRVNLEKGVFHCFGCGEKGNVLDFVSRKEAVGIKRAAELVVEWCGLKEKAGASEEPSDKNVSPEAGQKTAQSVPHPAPGRQAEDERAAQEGMTPLSFTLKLDPEHPYLKERGLTEETIAHFGLGYCNRGMMRGRVCIPIHNEAGELVGYCGRWVGDDAELSETEGKYKLPPKFEKSRVLFNLNRVPRWAMNRVEEVVLVEGYFSVFWLHQHGYPNVVSLMGRTLSDRQKALLVERFDRIRILMDGDAAGTQAGERIGRELMYHVHVKVLDCPEGKQPDHLTPEELKALLG